MQPLVRSSQTGYWIPAFAGTTDSALKPSNRVARFHGQVRNIKSGTAANTVVPAKAGIQCAR